jgi:hypothetical protein
VADAHLTYDERTTTTSASVGALRALLTVVDRLTRAGSHRTCVTTTQVAQCPRHLHAIEFAHPDSHRAAVTLRSAHERSAYSFVGVHDASGSEDSALPSRVHVDDGKHYVNYPGDHPWSNSVFRIKSLIV